MKKIILSITTATIVFAFNVNAATSESGIPEQHEANVRKLVVGKMDRRGWAIDSDCIEKIVRNVMDKGSVYNIERSVVSFVIEEAESRRREGWLKDQRATNEARIAEEIETQEKQALLRAIKQRELVSAEHVALIPGLIEEAEALSGLIKRQVRIDYKAGEKLLRGFYPIFRTVEMIEMSLTDEDSRKNKDMLAAIRRLRGKAALEVDMYE